MKNAQKVVAFLQKNRDRAFCDDCIQARLGLTDRTGAQTATKVLQHAPGFMRVRGQCPSCKSTRQKLLTKAT